MSATIEAPPHTETLIHIGEVTALVLHNAIGLCESCGLAPATVQVTIGSDTPYRVCWHCAP